MIRLFLPRQKTRKKKIDKLAAIYSLYDEFVENSKREYIRFDLFIIDEMLIPKKTQLQNQ